MASTRTLIRDLQPNQFIDAVFMMNNCQLGTTRNGKPFLKCLLSDRTGRLAARMWSCPEDLFNTLPCDGFVWVAAQTQPYQGEIQLIVQQIKPVEPRPEELTELLAASEHDPNDMFDELTDRLESIEDQSLYYLAQAYLGDQELMAKFKLAPAAQMLHHAYLSGLLEHTLNLIRLADVICPLYPKLNRDVITIGLFLHDLGKCSELKWETGFSYSEDGNLVGHIARGVIWLEQKAKQAEAAGHPLSPTMLRVLHHIILSHHGRPEYGALKVPATPEAILIHLIDNIDAKMNISLALTRDENLPVTENDDGFTEKIWSLETRLFKPDPSELESK